MCVFILSQGWGKSGGGRISGNKAGHFIQRFLEKENIARPIVVAPSMSGAFAIPYIMTGKAFTCQDRARGFVPLAPVKTDLFTDSQYHKCEVSQGPFKYILFKGWNWS